MVRTLLFYFLFFTSLIVYSQATGSTCQDLRPLCAGLTNVDSPGNNGSAQFGPFYGCLQQQPNPNWYLLQAGSNGTIIFDIVQFPDLNGDGIADSNSPIDVDFAIWGPFSSPTGNCNNLNDFNRVDCSFSSSGFEQVTIPNATAGDYYVLLITNFSRVDGVFNVTLNSNSTAQTTCAVLGDTYEGCDSDGDGFIPFDLTEIETELIDGDTALSVEFYDNASDAETNSSANTVASPYNFPAGSPTQFLYATILRGNTIERVVQLVFEEGLSPVTNDVSDAFCDDGTNSVLLNAYNTAILINAANVTITHHASASDAAMGNDPLSNSQNLSLGNNVFYARVDDEGCFSISELTFTVWENPQVTATPENLTECDADNSGSNAVDLTANETLILGSQTGMSFSYYTTAQAAQAGASATASEIITTPTAFTLNAGATRTVHLRLESDSNAECFVTTSFTVEVLELPIVPDDTRLESCDDGTNNILLSTHNATLYTGPLSVSISYHSSEQNALNNLSPITNQVVNPDVLLTVWARVSTNSAGQSCPTVVPVVLDVRSNPTLTTGQTLLVCDGNGYSDGQVEFDLRETHDLVTNMAADFTFSYYRNQIDAMNQQGALSADYVSTTAGDSVWVGVADDRGCYSFVEVALDFTINTLTSDVALESCGDQGEGMFDLTQYNTQVEQEVGQAGITVIYYTDLEDAEQGRNPIAEPTMYMGMNGETLYARAESNTNNCLGVVVFELAVLENPTITNNDFDVEICEGGDSTTVTAEGDFDRAEWRFNGQIVSTSETVTIDQTGEYELTVYNGFTSAECSRTEVFTVTFADRPQITRVEILANEQLQIQATGEFPPFEYSVDGINWQSSPLFTNLAAGMYDVLARNSLGCIGDAQTAVVINIPNALTPNGDGINDSWTVQGIEFLIGSQIRIFDRYNKLILDRTISESGFVWDGTYLGRPLPSGDYWFIVNLAEPTDGAPRQVNQFSGHITIKRR